MIQGRTEQLSLLLQKKRDELQDQKQHLDSLEVQEYQIRTQLQELEDMNREIESQATQQIPASLVTTVAEKETPHTLQRKLSRQKSIDDIGAKVIVTDSQTATSSKNHRVDLDQVRSAIDKLLKSVRIQIETNNKVRLVDQELVKIRLENEKLTENNLMHKEQIKKLEETISIARSDAGSQNVEIELNLSQIDCLNSELETIQQSTTQEKTSKKSKSAQQNPRLSSKNEKGPKGLREGDKHQEDNLNIEEWMTINLKKIDPKDLERLLTTLNIKVSTVDKPVDPQIKPNPVVLNLRADSILQIVDMMKLFLTKEEDNLKKTIDSFSKAAKELELTEQLLKTEQSKSETTSETDKKYILQLYKTIEDHSKVVGIRKVIVDIQGMRLLTQKLYLNQLIMLTTTEFKNLRIFSLIL